MVREQALTQKNQPWYKNWPPQVPKHIPLPQVPLQGLLEASAKQFPDKPAVTYAGRELTYKELDAQANQFGNALAALGVKKGDCVALYLPNIPQFPIAFFGALKAGAAVSAISPLHREREVEYQLSDSGAQTVVALDSLCPIVEAVRQKTAVKTVIATGLDEYALQPAPATTTPNTESFQKLISVADRTQPRIQISPERDLAALQYTGGTTGTAKAAMLTHRNLLSNALAFAAYIRGTVAQETFLVALPLFHIYGMTTSMTVPTSLAAKMVLLPRFEPAKVLELIERQRVSVFCGVPTMYQVLLANPDLSKHDLKSIRVCISGASSLPPQVQKQFMEVTGGFLAEGYGLTEASPVTHCTPVDRAAVKVGSIGLPLPDTDARIVDLETGTPLPSGETGELAVRGPQVMAGYWKNPQETAGVLRDGWLLTGDIAHMDDDGYFYITDRKKDLIKTKGYSVYPRELEDILYEHPAVKLCAVVGKPDPTVGEAPKAYVVLKEGASASTQEFMLFVNGKVAAYKAIREVEFRSELPMSSAGKVLRRVLLEEEKAKRPG